MEIIEYTAIYKCRLSNHQKDYEMIRGFICPHCEEVVEPDYIEVE